MNSLRCDKDKRLIYAVVSRNVFYEIELATNKVVKCIKFNKHSITSFFCLDNLLIFGNIENKMLVYDLKTFEADTPDKFKPVKAIEGLGGWILTIEFMNGYLYAGCDDRKIRVYRWPEIEEVE